MHACGGHTMYKFYLYLYTWIGMVHKCIVPGCLNQSNQKKGLKFHRQKWLDLMGRTSVEVTVNNRICSAHFTEGGWQNSGSKVPVIFPWRQLVISTTTHTMKLLTTAHATFLHYLHCIPRSQLFQSSSQSFFTNYTDSFSSIYLNSIEAVSLTENLQWSVAFLTWWKPVIRSWQIGAWWYSKQHQLTFTTTYHLQRRDLNKHI